MKKTLLLSAAVLCSAIALAQSSAQPLSNQNLWNDRPEVIIKGEELKDFPGGQLMEMLLGRFSGLDIINAKQTKVTFVVDGFVWSTIDALNINDIDEVAYYRGGLNSKLGVQNTGPGGVLYITTKTTKFNQPFIASVNTLLGTNVLDQEDGKDRSTLQSYHVALAQGLEKFSWRAAAFYNQNTRNLNRFDFTHQYQFNGDIQFSPLKWLDLRGNVNYGSSKGDSPITKEAYLSSERQVKYKQDNWNGVFYVKAEPLKGLLNETRVLKSSIGSDDDLYSSTSYLSSSTRSYNKNLVNRNKINFAVLDDLSYRFGVNKDRIKIKTTAIFQYNDQKDKEDFRRTYYLGNEGWDAVNALSLSETWSEMKSKTYTVAGDIFVNFYDVLSLVGGVRKDNYNMGNGKDYYAPYYYADLNLKHLFLKSLAAVNDVLLFGSYGKYRSEIEVINPEVRGGGMVQGSSFFNGNLNTNFEKMKMQNYGVKTRLFDRISLSGDWYKNDNYIYNNLFIPGFGTYPALFPTKYSGWKVCSTVEIFRESKFKWNAGLNVFKNKHEIGARAGNDIILNKSELGETIATQAGMQQGFSYLNFSLNMNAIGYFDRPVFVFGENRTRAVEKATFIDLNYLSFGCDLKDQVKGTALKNLNVNFVARNLAQRKKHVEDNVFSKTFGIALNASF